MKVVLAERALAEQDAIFDYLSGRSPSGARNVMAAIERALARIEAHPESGQVTRQRHVRSVVLGHHPYRIFYRLERDRTLVLHIRHTSRRPVAG